jgi:hypothetical protein
MCATHFQAGKISRPVVIVTVVLILFLGTACQKDPGFGGNGAIYGTIVEKFFNDDYSVLLYEQPAVDEEVFILFGDDKQLGDRIFTSITGDFRFDYLYPGSYQLYYESDDTTGLIAGDWGAFQQVEIDRGEELDLGQLEKITALDYDDGAAVIKGVVWEINYVNESRWPLLVVESEDFAHEHEVYLIYGDHPFYDERVRTQYDGYFEFSDLIPGNYQVFLYSEDVKRLTDHVVLQFEVTIHEMDQVVDLGEITIEKR